MKNAIIIIIAEEIPIPNNGFIDGGWYAGRQYYHREFGGKGEMISNTDKRGYVRISEKEKKEFIKKLKESTVYK